MTMVFSGDFRQVLPVIPKGSQDIINASLKQSYLWDHCKVLKLTANMRLTVDAIPEDAKIINGTHFRKEVIIPRLRITPSDKRLPMKIIRKQYHLSLSFAMTINKSQGQSFLKVGLYLSRPVFTHGQLYVALSRFKSKRGLKVCDEEGCMDYGSYSEVEDGSYNGCLDCGSDSEAEDGLEKSMIVNEGEQDFTNPTDRRKFGLEDDQASLKLKASNDETDVEALQVGDYHFLLK
uniref:ATP-dependent DNA helicase n=1 Tax=Tanacetum cinerariifolium TaxID=118510 RepID=A0A6L2P9Z4_TANCI|nr:ATP-dependent DNA helicase PIF1-like [Tanacetum cinerariifolium]